MRVKVGIDTNQKVYGGSEVWGKKMDAFGLYNQPIRLKNCM
jgi:hypothetical protein